jgi:methylated-DNA-protein-cysteine methyltransferase-like protein
MTFKQQVLRAVNSIPYGKVATYGQIAAMAGSPRAARQVGWILAGLTTAEAKVPWWRVLNAKGHLSIRNQDPAAKAEQKVWLESEGIEVSPDLDIDLEKYLYRP